MGIELANPQCIRIPAKLIVIIAAVVLVIAIGAVILFRMRKSGMSAKKKGAVEP